MKVNYNKGILILFQILLGIQWIRMTVVMVGLIKINQTDLMLQALQTYYLVMIGIILCSGFLYMKKKIKKEEDEK